MKINKITLKKWIDPKLITYHLSKKFGDNGLAWLDSDGKENGEWSIIGLKIKVFKYKTIYYFSMINQQKKKHRQPVLLCIILIN